MQILLANPRGFCAGVDRAIVIVKHALEMLGTPIYVRHEIVHNRAVLEELRAQGAVFVEQIQDIPPGANVIFSAHGVPPSVHEQAEQRRLQVFDATCPLVSKVHMEVARFGRLEYECILIGHAGHPEVEGTLGYYHCAKGAIYLIEHEREVEMLSVKKPAVLGYVTQTTLSSDDTQRIVAALKRRFPMIVGPKKDDICYATQNRQEAVKALAQHSDIVLVVGSKNSSNSNRLKEVAEQGGKPAYLIDSVADIQAEWLLGKTVIGITAGASAPEVLVQAVVTQLRDWGADFVSELAGISEKVHFALPRELRFEDMPPL